MKLRSEDSGSDYESPESILSNSSGDLNIPVINITGSAKLQPQNTNLNKGSRNQYSKL